MLKKEGLGNIYVRDYMIHMAVAYTYQKKEMLVTNASYTPYGRTRVHVYIYMHRVLRASDRVLSLVRMWVVGG